MQALSNHRRGVISNSGRRKRWWSSRYSESRLHVRQSCEGEHPNLLGLVAAPAPQPFVLQEHRLCGWALRVNSRFRGKVSRNCGRGVSVCPTRGSSFVEWCMRTQSYPSDLTDAQWRLIEPHLPVYPGGRPRTTNLRDVVDAILYILRTGCQWRYLPKDFPPKSTVWKYFDQWRRNGTFETIHDLLRRKVRSEEKPYSPRTSASVDSQSVDTTSGGEQRGRDNAKNVDGRKRHIVVDSMGLLMAILVTAANIDDAKAAADLFVRLGGQPMSHVKTMYADTKYHNFILYEWVEKNVAWELSIVQRPKDAVGWVLLPIRWTVERTFAWLGKCRRLSKDREKSVLSSENVRPVGHDSPDAQPARTQERRGTVRIPSGCVNRLVGQTLSRS